jgi:hypothetical protein
LFSYAANIPELRLENNKKMLRPAKVPAEEKRGQELPMISFSADPGVLNT